MKTSYPKPIRWGLGIIYSVLSLAVIAYIGVRMVTPTIVTPPRPLLPPTNGYNLLTVAAKKIVKDAGSGNPSDNTSKKPLSLSEKQAAIMTNADAIRLAKQALRYPYREENHLVSLDDSDKKYASFRSMTRALVLAGNVVWEEGKQKEAVDFFVDGITIGRQMPHRVGVLPRLVGMACESTGRRALWNHQEQMDTDAASIALQRLNALEGERLPLWESLEEEKYSALCIAMEAMGHPQHSGKTKGPAFGSYASLVPPRYVVRAMGGHFDDLIAQSKRPYIEGNKEIPEPKEIFCAILAPVTSTLRTKDTADCAGDRLLRTTLALRVYKSRVGKLPSDLNELVKAKLLAQMPEDPFAKPGTPLQYKPQPDGKYLLYSIGPDGVDDGGKGIDNKAAGFRVSRLVKIDSKGDMVAGWYPY